jgi:HSP20 family protein
MVWSVRASALSPHHSQIDDEEDMMAIEFWRPRRGQNRTQGSPQQHTGLARLERQIDDMFDRLSRDASAFRGGEAEATAWAPALDVIDRKDELVIRADLPGLSEKDVEVEVEDGILDLRGKRTEEHEEKDQNYYYAERWEGAFNRSIALPSGVDAEKVSATFKNGVLEIRLPKKEEMRGKKVDIKAA